MVMVLLLMMLMIEMLMLKASMMMMMMMSWCVGVDTIFAAPPSPPPDRPVPLRQSSSQQ